LIVGSASHADVADAADAGETGNRLKPRLDLRAIEQSLRDVQADFERINADLNVVRDPMSGEVIESLISAYAYIDEMLGAGVDLLARGNSPCMLRLNRLVLWGVHDVAVGARELQETERRFYDDASAGGVRALMNYVADHDDENVWTRAAGVYTQILTSPQLFLEGNHRTAALIVSHALAQAGKPPFVLTQTNSREYFDLSSTLKSCRKRSLRSALEIPRLRRRFARLMEHHADARFLSW
jgi:hypothetical protein